MSCRLRGLGGVCGRLWRLWEPVGAREGVAVSRPLSVAVSASVSSVQQAEAKTSHIVLALAGLLSQTPSRCWTWRPRLLCSRPLHITSRHGMVGVGRVPAGGCDRHEPDTPGVVQPAHKARTRRRRHRASRACSSRVGCRRRPTAAFTRRASVSARHGPWLSLARHQRPAQSGLRGLLVGRLLSPAQCAQDGSNHDRRLALPRAAGARHRPDRALLSTPLLPAGCDARWTHSRTASRTLSLLDRSVRAETPPRCISSCT